jgi:hypothetical protein
MRCVCMCERDKRGLSSKECDAMWVHVWASCEPHGPTSAVVRACVRVVVLNVQSVVQCIVYACVSITLLHPPG